MADPARFAFVRDGFYWWAFLLTPLWLLWRRLWLVFVLYLVVSIGIETAMRICGASSGLISLVVALISLLVGLEASSLQRFTLRRRGWKNVGVVSGSDLEDAERRFFAAWVRTVPHSDAPGAPPAAPTAQPPHSPYASGVVGLFPEPGAQR
jgi:Protein of unknown function (DUF2628)